MFSPPCRYRRLRVGAFSSNCRPPSVIISPCVLSTVQVSEVESRSVLIQLSAPECNQPEFEIYPSEFRYELWLSEKGRDGKYKLVYRYKWRHLSGNPVSLAINTQTNNVHPNLNNKESMDVCASLLLAGSTSQLLSFLPFALIVIVFAIIKHCSPDKYNLKTSNV